MVAGALAALLIAAVAGAQEPAHDAECAEPGVPPSDLASWDTRTPANATPGAYDLAIAVLEVGHAVDATLKPIEQVDFVVDPERWPEPGTYAGMFSFEAPAPGTYKVALSQGAWIDVVFDDKLVPSAGFGLQPRCTSVRKAVAFDLERGLYVLQLSGNPTPDLAVMIGYSPADGGVETAD
jgi:hypothetical protein